MRQCGTHIVKIWNLLLLGMFISLSACGILPQTSNIDENQLRKEVTRGSVKIQDISPELIESLSLSNVRGSIGCGAGLCPENWDYLIGAGDVLSIVVWEHPQLTIPAGPNRSPQEAGNRVHADGTIFYPYVGKLMVQDRTLSEVREQLTEGLKKIIPDPQVDVSIAHFRENNKVYVLGEVARPGQLVLGLSRMSLTEAVAQSGGVAKSDANASGIFVFRTDFSSGNVNVFRLDGRSPTAFMWATRFNLREQDVVYVTSAPATRWGRIISKLIPSLAALNTLQILGDNL